MWQGKGIQSAKCSADSTIVMTVPEEGFQSGTFDSTSQARLLQKNKDLEMQLQRVQLHAETAEQQLEMGKSSYIESEQNAVRLQKQVDALLAERVDLYMKMQSLESQLSISVTDRTNLDKQLQRLVNIPTKLEEVAS